MTTLHSSQSLVATTTLALLETQRRVLAQVASKVPLADVFDGLAREMEASFTGSLTAIELLHESGTGLWLCAAPSLPGFYSQAIDGFGTGLVVSSSGCTEVSDESLVYVSDIATDPLWAEHRDLAFQHGLTACWMMSIRGTNDQVLGTLAIYHSEPRILARDDIEMMAVMARTVGLVKLHGGSIQATSAGLGYGSEFVVQLPRSAEQKSQATAGMDSNATLTEGPVHAKRILVVDDNVDAANTVSEILRMLGNEVMTLHDGLEAVIAAAEMAPDIIILDIGLPSIDGYEAARRIRAQKNKGRAAMLIALTGWGQAVDKQRAYQAGFDRHWVKPVSLDQLKKI